MMKRTCCLVAISGLFLFSLCMGVSFARDRHERDYSWGGHTRDYERIITRAYEDVLGREPDTDGMRHYRSLMIDDGWTERDVRDDLRKSDEHRNYDVDTIITRAYEDILGRKPDPDGMRNYRCRMIDDGWSERDVRNDLRDSKEYRSVDYDTVITRAYEDLLGRKPDPGGMANYRRLMKDEGWDEDDVRHALKKSDEYRSKH